MDIYFGSGTVYSDGSVKWPRWKVTATGGLALLQRREARLRMAFAESVQANLRQPSVNMEMGGGFYRVWSGYRQRAA